MKMKKQDICTVGDAVEAWRTEYVDTDRRTLIEIGGVSRIHGIKRKASHNPERTGSRQSKGYYTNVRSGGLKEFQLLRAAYDKASQ